MSGLKRMLFYTFFGFLAVLLFALFTFPKFLLLERILLKNNVYMTAESVEEGIASIALKRVNLYTQGSRFMYFDSLKLYLLPFKVVVNGLCEGKELRAELSIFSKSVSAESFRCTSLADSLSASIRIKDGLYGTLSLKGINAQGFKIDELSIQLRGKVFTAKAKAMGFELLGDGQIDFKSSNFLQSKINGYISGAGLRFNLSGTLEKPQLSK
ncbi:MAG: hypothetical protein N3C57_04715 [Aquificaceae bacterium]|nr:hypothetical protein [Aquificaceae bacterium]